VPHQHNAASVQPVIGRDFLQMGSGGFYILCASRPPTAWIADSAVLNVPGCDTGAG
jgi:hypothetical protein